jgi:hypothetical protein
LAYDRGGVVFFGREHFRRSPQAPRSHSLGEF